MTAGVEVLHQDVTLREAMRLETGLLARDLASGHIVDSATTVTRSFRAWMDAGGARRLPAQMADYLANELNISVLGILTGFWSSMQEIRRCAKETRDDKKRQSDVDLAEHAFVHETDLDMNILLNNQRVASIPFSLETTCTVKGLRLSIRHGAIYKIGSGHCECELAILCGKASLWKRGPVKLPFPGEHHLHRPFVIEG